MSNDARTPGEIRDQQIDQHLGTHAPELEQLWDRLVDDYTVEGWGLAHFAAMSDDEQRAVSSDLVLSAVEGIQVNLRELAMSASDVERYSGPNGTTLPGPTTTLEEYLDHKRLHRAVTESVRAFGSTLDCLAAVTIGLLGLPSSLQAASGAALLTFPQLPDGAPKNQQALRRRAQMSFERMAEAPPGWLAWALELRNAVVHRGHLTQVMLQRPSDALTRLHVRTNVPPQYLVRVEPHLRGRPWQPDMLTLSGPGSAADALIWLPEPAAVTVSEIQARAVTLVRVMCEELGDALSDEHVGLLVPEKQWRLERDPAKPKAQTERAARFTGFDPSYPMPPLGQMRVHPKSVPRLQLAERLRTSLWGQRSDD